MKRSIMASRENVNKRKAATPNQQQVNPTGGMGQTQFQVQNVVRPRNERTHFVVSTVMADDTTEGSADVSDE